MESTSDPKKPKRAEDKSEEEEIVPGPGGPTGQGTALTREKSEKEAPGFARRDVGPGPPQDPPPGT